MKNFPLSGISTESYELRTTQKTGMINVQHGTHTQIKSHHYKLTKPTPRLKSTAKIPISSTSRGSKPKLQLDCSGSTNAPSVPQSTTSSTSQKKKLFTGYTSNYQAKKVVASKIASNAGGSFGIQTKPRSTSGSQPHSYLKKSSSSSTMLKPRPPNMQTLNTTNYVVTQTNNSQSGLLSSKNNQTSSYQTISYSNLPHSSRGVKKPLCQHQ